MTVKDHGDVLHHCLNSVKDVCDEIIIVDLGSTDKTNEIAQEFTNKIIDFKGITDSRTAKILAFNNATMDYIFWLDAGDFLLEEDQLKFKELKKFLNTTIDAVSLICHLELDEDGKPSLSYRSNRLVKREKNNQWKGNLDEDFDVRGTIYQSDIAINKSNKTTPVQGDQSLLFYERRILNGETFTPRDLYNYANVLKEHSRLRKAIMYYREFLTIQKGSKEDQIRACINMAECYKYLGDELKEKESLVMSFVFDAPRPDVSCCLGDYHKEKSDYKQAIVWYRLALENELDNHAGLSKITYSTWYPHLQLCFCYWQVGNKEKSVEHNNKAKEYRPNDPQVKYNEQFFKEYFSNVQID